MLFCQTLAKGTGTPLLFLHGILGSSEDWKPLVAHLNGRTCLAVDLPGHGKTPWHWDEIEDLLMQVVPNEGVHLVGYSLGGRLALRYALHHPERIQAMTLLSTHFGLDCEKEKAWRLKEDAEWAQKLLSGPFDEFLRDWYDKPIFSSLHRKPSLFEEILAMRRLQKPHELARAFLQWSLAYQPCYREALRAFSRPLNILYGDQDPKFSQLYAGWPQAKAIQFAGHVLHLENPKQVAENL